ncbi:rhodanese-like domain-containing protein [Streptomyces tropicalis]|uniref:Rhodanese-like domain-containing protein n=1 Tax=Streptomyces tropicalis TaxID=3034234 RepID=A0ABT6A2H8_9ACTN|nr:rhodanese-like domain-containing protein [Streptomyces tropicalis]MDF3298856.1 rhodanese-like domain-containing protein [Streptomyces tropicalis]
MPSSSTPEALAADQAGTRLGELTVIDVRTPGEFAEGHLPGALNIPLDRLRHALPEIRHAAGQGEVLLVCASGARSEGAARLLADAGVTAATLTGGTGAWAAAGHALHRSEAPGAHTTWSMERQVRLTAGALVLTGLLLGFLVHPAFELLSAAIAGGLVFSALTDTCGMAVVLGKLPHNRPRAADLDAARAALLAR